MRRTTAGWVVVGAALVSLAACSSAKPSGTGTAGPTTTPVVAASSALPASSPTPSAAKNLGCTDVTAGWSTTPAPIEVNSTDSAVVNKADAGKHECFDQITFTTATIAPIGVSVDYVDAVTSQGKGDKVPVDGGAVLRVNIIAWSYCIDPKDTSASPAPKSCWAPGDRISAGSGQWPAIKEVRYAGTQERTTTFAVGVASNKLPVYIDKYDDAASGKTFVTVMVAHP